MTELDKKEVNKSLSGVQEPNRPGHFLLSRLAATSDDPTLINEEQGADIAARRALLEHCYEHIEEIGSQLLQNFSDLYAKHGLHVQGELRFYVVGGRLTDKPLHYDSDIDCAITIAYSGEDLRPLYGKEPKELTDKKRSARAEFIRTALSSTGEKYGFQLNQTSESGEPIKGSLVEPKEYGTSDEVFRSRNLPAVLVAKYIPAPRGPEKVGT